MPFDVFAILKAVWAVISFLLIGILKITYSDYKKTQTRLEELDRDIIRIKAEMVTKDKLDEVLDKKLKAVREDVFDLRKHIKDDVNGLRGDLNKQFQMLMDRDSRKRS